MTTNCQSTLWISAGQRLLAATLTTQSQNDILCIGSPVPCSRSPRLVGTGAREERYPNLCERWQLYQGEI